MSAARDVARYRKVKVREHTRRVVARGDTKATSDLRRGEPQRRRDAAADRRRAREVRDVKSKADLDRGARFRRGTEFALASSDAAYAGAVRRGVRHPELAASSAFDVARTSDTKTANLAAPALAILHELTRPIHGVAGLTQHGPAGLYRGLIENKPYSFRHTAGIRDLPGPLPAIVGTGADILLDPSTYVGGVVTAPAKIAARVAAEKATGRALERGLSKRAADRAGRVAASEVLAKRAPDARGLALTVAGKRVTSGRGTAAAGRALTPAARKAFPVVRHVRPQLRHPEVSPASFERMRHATRRGRQMASIGSRDAYHEAVAVAKAVGGGAEHPKVFDALERLPGGHRATPEELRAATKNLSPGEAKAVAHAHRRYHELGGQERSDRVLGALFEDFGYAPRYRATELDGTPKGPRGTKATFAQQRTNRVPRSEFRDDPALRGFYTENFPLTHFLRVRESGIVRGRRHVIDALKRESRAVKAGGALREGERLYRFKPGAKPLPLTEREMADVAAGGQKAGNVLRDGPVRAVHPELVRMAEQGVPHHEDLSNLARIWDRQLQGRLKTALTVPNPQYHFTNLYGDIHNAYLEAPLAKVLKNMGVSGKALVYKARREAAAETLGKHIELGVGAKTIRLKDGKRVSLADLVREADEVGATGQGFLAADLPEFLQLGAHQAAEMVGRGRVARKLGKAGEAAARSKVGRRLGHPIQGLRAFGQYREDLVRLATYIGARKRGLSPDAAADRVVGKHFDYGDLTTFERSVLRRVFPFWTWTARNTPLQAQALVTRPGKFGNIQKLREGLADATGTAPDYEERLKEYEQRGVPFVLPRGLPDFMVPGGGKGLLFPKLPLTDLNRLGPQGQGDAILSMITPLIKAPIELNQNYNFFFKDKIDRYLDRPDPATGKRVQDFKPAPAWLAGIMDSIGFKTARDTVAKVPGLHVLGEVLRVKKIVKDGKRVWAWPARLDYVLKQTPLSGTALQFGTGAPNTRGQSSSGRAFGFATGLKVTPLTTSRKEEDRLFQARAYLQAQAEAMRSQGEAYVDGNKARRTPEYQQLLDRVGVLERKLGLRGGKGGRRKRFVNPDSAPSSGSRRRRFVVAP